MRQKTARPRRMVRRRVRPSIPAAPHMGAAMAVFERRGDGPEGSTHR